MNISKIIVGLVASAFIGSAFAQGGTPPVPAPAPIVGGDKVPGPDGNGVKHKKPVAAIMMKKHRDNKDGDGPVKKAVKYKAAKKIMD